MVPTGQCHEPSARDAGGDLAPGFDWNHLVVPHVHHERRRLHFGEQIDDIEIVDGFEIANGALGRGRFPLQLVENVRLFMRCSRDEKPCEHLPKGWIVRAPSNAHQSRHRIPSFFLRRRALLSAERERAIENKVRHPFRAPHRIGDRDGAALGYSEERETLDTDRINDCLKVGHPGIERERVNVPVGHAVASRVVAYERVLARQPAKDMTPNRAFPIVFQMVQPVS